MATFSRCWQSNLHSVLISWSFAWARARILDCTQSPLIRGKNDHADLQQQMACCIRAPRLYMTAGTLTLKFVCHVAKRRYWIMHLTSLAMFVLSSSSVWGLDPGRPPPPPRKKKEEKKWRILVHPEKRWHGYLHFFLLLFSVGAFRNLSEWFHRKKRWIPLIRFR